MNLNNIVADRLFLIEILTSWDSGSVISTDNAITQLGIEIPPDVTYEIQKGFLLFLCHYFHIGLG